MTEERKKIIQNAVGGRDREAIYQTFKIVSERIQKGLCPHCGGELSGNHQCGHSCKACGWLD